MSMALGKNIRTLRIAKGIDQTALSRLSGVSVVNISAMELRNSVRSQYAPKLAHALGVDLELLLSDDFELGMVATQTTEPTPPVAIQATTSRYCSVRQAITTLTILVEEAPANERKAIMHLINSALESPAIAPYVIDALKSLMESAAIASRVPMESQVESQVAYGGGSRALHQ